MSDNKKKMFIFCMKCSHRWNQEVDMSNPDQDIKCPSCGKMFKARDFGAK